MLVDDFLQVIDLLKKLSNELPVSDRGQLPIPLLDFVRYQFAMAVLMCLRGHASSSLTFARGMLEACGHACVLAEDPRLIDLWQQNSVNEKPDKRYREAFKTSRLFPAADADRKRLGELYALFSLRTHPSAVVLHSHQVPADDGGFTFDYNDAKTPADVLDHFVLVIDTLLICLRALRKCWRTPTKPDSFVRWDEEFQFMRDRFGRHVRRMSDIRKQFVDDADV